MLYRSVLIGLFLFSKHQRNYESGNQSSSDRNHNDQTAVLFFIGNSNLWKRFRMAFPAQAGVGFLALGRCGRFLRYRSLSPTVGCKLTFFTADRTCLPMGFSICQPLVPISMGDGTHFFTEIAIGIAIVVVGMGGLARESAKSTKRIAGIVEAVARLSNTAAISPA